MHPRRKGGHQSKFKVKVEPRRGRARVPESTTTKAASADHRDHAVARTWYAKHILQRGEATQGNAWSPTRSLNRLPPYPTPGSHGTQGSGGPIRPLRLSKHVVAKPMPALPSWSHRRRTPATVAHSTASAEWECPPSQAHRLKAGAESSRRGKTRLLIHSS